MLPQSKLFPRIAAALFALLLLLNPSAAQARTLTIQNFKSEVTVLTDSAVDVTETVVAHFAGSWNGLYRTIPIEYEYHGFDYALDLRMMSITDDSGAALKYEMSRQTHYLKFKIYVPDAVDATRTIILHYRVQNALKFFDDHDELYWNVTGDEWDVPIADTQAEISLPAGVTGLRATNFTGGYGSNAQDATVSVEGAMVNVATKRSLDFHEGLTVVVGWDKGLVHEPTPSQQIELFLSNNWPLFFPFIAFILMFYVWWTRGRDPRRNPIAVQYDPPDQLTPGELGTLVDCSANMRDISATLVDLAVRGYIQIEEKDSSHLAGLYKSKDYTFHLLKPLVQWNGLKDHEIKLLSGMFSNGAADSVDLEELHNTFYTNIPPIKNSLLDSLVEHGYFLHRPDNTRGAWIGIGFVVGVLMVMGGVWLGSNYGMQPLPFFIGGILTGLVIIAFGWFMPAHTSQGMRAYEKALGFEDFLQRVESDKIERVEKTPALFEKFLPFAMALGVEKKWCGAFQGIATQPPSWYTGGVYGPNFYPIMFASNLNMMSTATVANMVSAPRSVGGSGFGGGGFGGGGGFSGGGFGGGGGGGF